MVKDNTAGSGSADPWESLSRFPRQRLARFPAPLQPLRRLGQALGGLDRWFRRDDLISFGLGDNKVRGLEFLPAAARTEGADAIVTGAGPQSNHVRATAATAASAGLQCIAVFWGDPPVRVDGDYRLTRMLGAEVVFTGDPDRSTVDRCIQGVCETLRGEGRRPHVIPPGGPARWAR